MNKIFIQLFLFNVFFVSTSIIPAALEIKKEKEEKLKFSDSGVLITPPNSHRTQYPSNNPVIKYRGSHVATNLDTEQDYKFQKLLSQFEERIKKRLEGTIINSNKDTIVKKIFDELINDFKSEYIKLNLNIHKTQSKDIFLNNCLIKKINEEIKKKIVFQLCKKTGDLSFLKLILPDDVNNHILSFHLDSMNFCLNKNLKAKFAKFSNNNQFLAVAYFDGIVVIRDLINKNIPDKFIKHNGPINCIAFSPDSNYIATASDDGSAKITDLKNNLYYDDGCYSIKSIAIFDRKPARFVTFSPDSKYAAVSFDKKCKIRNLITEQKIADIVHGDFIDKIVFSSNSKYIATAASDKTSKVRNLVNPEIPDIVIQTRAIAYDIKFSPNDQFIVTNDFAGNTKIKDLINKEARDLDILGKSIFSPDGKYLAILSGATITIKDLTNKAVSDLVIQNAVEISQEISHICFSPNNQYIAIGSTNGTVKIKDLKNDKVLQEDPIEIMRLKGFINKIKISPNNQFVAAGSYLGYVKVKDIVNRSEPLFELPRCYKDLKFSHNSQYLMSYSTEKVNVKDLFNKKVPILIFKLNPTQLPEDGIQYRFINNVHTFNNLTPSIDAEFSPNSEYLAISSADGAFVHIFNPINFINQFKLNEEEIRLITNLNLIKKRITEDSTIKISDRDLQIYAKLPSQFKWILTSGHKFEIDIKSHSETMKNKDDSHPSIRSLHSLHPVFAKAMTDRRSERPLNNYDEEPKLRKKLADNSCVIL